MVMTMLASTWDTLLLILYHNFQFLSSWKTMDEEEAKHLGSQGTLDAQAITSSSCYLITLSGELCG